MAEILPIGRIAFGVGVRVLYKEHCVSHYTTNNLPLVFTVNLPLGSTKSDILIAAGGSYWCCAGLCRERRRATNDDIHVYIEEVC